MKNKAILAVLMVTTVLLVSGCATDEGAGATTVTTVTTTATTDNGLPTTAAGYIGSTTTSRTYSTGGWDGDVFHTWQAEFSIESALRNLVNQEAYQQWKNDFESSGGPRSKYEFNVYELIQEFGITRAQVEELCRDIAEENEGEVYFTEEQIDILFTGTREEVYRYFFYATLLYIPETGGVYPSRWFAEHTAEEYAAAGITQEMVEPLMGEMLTELRQEQQEHFMTQWERFKNGDFTTQQTTTITNTQQTGIDPENWHYTRRYVLEFSIESAITKLLDTTEFDQWCDTFEHFDAGGTRSSLEFNVYELIQEFGITREQVEGICRDYKERFDEEYFTDEQVDILFTGSREEVYRYFAYPTAIFIAPGDGVYPVKWLSEHTATEYLEVGITYDILNAKINDVLDSGVPEAVREHILAQKDILQTLSSSTAASSVTTTTTQPEGE